ncbi:MAG: MBL fold metallo-hydrolase [Candidatus Lokiarchaeota archaeon]|nr:MBL fold metallo-hydrolase [Candidatus Lokiarchaeota archaeon]
MNDKYFQTIKIYDDLYVIRERLWDIDPRFLTEYTNMYLVLGTHSALLIDTGSGVFSIKRTIEKIIGDRTLFVLNTHSDWDHVGSNHEFSEIFIHEQETRNIQSSIDISELKSSPTSLAKRYANFNFKIAPTKSILSIVEGKKFDLGGIELEVFHVPGHSNGSVALISSNGDLFTGDAAHYGSVYIPHKKNIHIFLNSLDKLIQISKKKRIIKIFPSHEQYEAGVNLLTELKDELLSVEQTWNQGSNNKFLNAWIIEGEKFKFIITN